jgi:hypothetical protein
MNEKREILSTAKRRDLEIRAQFCEDLGFLPAVVAKLRAELAADDQARLHEASCQRGSLVVEQ